VRPPEPRFFDQATAAAYFGISERTFEAQWRSYQMPHPRRIGRRLVWDRKILDQYADAISGITGLDESRIDPVR
jgi:predicted DNA-binding transcriptional regulator AlpA